MIKFDFLSDTQQRSVPVFQYALEVDEERETLCIFWVGQVVITRYEIANQLL